MTSLMRVCTVCFGIFFDQGKIHYRSIGSTSIKAVMDVNKCLAYSHEI